MLLERKEPSLLEFLMILILLNDRLYTMPFLEHQDFPVFPNIEEIIFVLAIFVLVYRMGIQQNNSSLIVLCQKGIQ